MADLTNSLLLYFGGQDHRALIESVQSNDVNKTYRSVFESLGINGIL